MDAILFALLAHIGWGVGDLFGAIVSRKIGGYSATFWSYIVRIPLLALYIPFILDDVAHLNVTNVLITGLLSLIVIAGNVLHAEAFLSSNASLVGTIGAAFVVPTVILSVIFFDETLTGSQVAAVIVIVVGLVLTTLDFNSLAKKQFVLDRGIVLSFISMLLWGVYFAFVRIPIQEIGWFLPFYFVFLFAPVILLIMKWQKVALRHPNENQALPALIGFMVCSTVANFAYNLGIVSGYTSIVAPIAGSYPVLFVILSFIFFKERVQRQQLLGIVVSLVGIVALSFMSI